jgi:hypothetical protein
LGNYGSNKVESDNAGLTAKSQKLTVVAIAPTGVLALSKLLINCLIDNYTNCYASRLLKDILNDTVHGISPLSG